jgi:tyrosine-protein phosphatase YwqE
MFNFFKKNKPQHAAHALPGKLPFSVDMHSHILPGIDDGSPDLETSVLLVRGLYDLGISTCIATPHIIGALYPNNHQTIEAALGKLQKALVMANVPMQVTAAAEYMLDDYFMELLQKPEPLRTLHDNWLLTEIPYTTEPVNLPEMVFHIITGGYQPVLAHPERYLYFHNDLRYYKKLKDLGFILQVNLLSLTGYYGKPVASAAKYILKEGLAGLVGTDLHHGRHLSALQSAQNQQLFNKYITGSDLMNNSLVL